MSMEETCTAKCSIYSLCAMMDCFHNQNRHRADWLDLLAAINILCEACYTDLS